MVGSFPGIPLSIASLIFFLFLQYNLVYPLFLLLSLFLQFDDVKKLRKFRGIDNDNRLMNTTVTSNNKYTYLSLKRRPLWKYYLVMAKT